MGSVYKPKLKSGGEGSTFWISYYANGKRIRESSGTENRRQAEDLLKVREGAAASGTPVIRRMDRISYEEARADLLADYQTHATRNLSEAGCRLLHLDPYFAGRKISTIGPADATAYAAHRQAQGAANGTLNRELAVLSKMLRVAVDNRKLTQAPRLKKAKESSPRSGFVDRAEFDSITRHLPVELQTASLVAFTYGWRKQECLSRQLRHLDLNAGTLRLDPGETKNGEGRVVHLTRELRDALAAQVDRIRALEQEQGRIIPWLFPHLSGRHAGAQVSDLKKQWAAACRKAGRPGILFHDLRRSAVRNLERASVSRSVAMKMTGHKTESVYRRYAIVSDSDLLEATSKLEGDAAGHAQSRSAVTFAISRQVK